MNNHLLPDCKKAQSMSLRHSLFRLHIPAILALLACPALAHAAANDMAAPVLDYARNTPYLKIAVLLTLLSFIPALMVATTAFTRIIIVLSSIRYGLGMQETPSNLVLVTLALFLTLFVMSPTLKNLQTDALQPYMDGSITSSQFLDRASSTLENFMLQHTRDKELQLVHELAVGDIKQAPAKISVASQRSLFEVIPAFMLSELRVAFQMAFMVLLPFLLVDLIVSVSLMSLGMMMVPPTTISMPLKILMFVLADGWMLIARSLVDSYHG